MTAWLKAFATLFAMALVPTHIAAQVKPAAAPPESQTTGTPTPMDRLRFLVGSWDLTAKYEKSAIFPDGGEAHGNYVVKSGPGGFSTIGDFRWTGGPEKEISGHEAITWDAVANTYQRYTFGNDFPLPYISAGRWDGNNLVFDGDLEVGRTKYHFRESIAPSPSGGLTMSESYRTGDAPMQLMLTTTLQKSSSAADDAATAARSAAALSPELQKLSFLIGKWQYTETYEKSRMMPDGGTGGGTYSAAAGPGGQSIITDFEESGAMAGSAGHEIFAWDAANKEYVGYMFSSNAPGCFTRGGKWEANQLVFTRDIKGSRGTMRMRFVYAEAKADSVIVQVYAGMGDAPVALVMTMKGTR
jgi:hypothetical protein